MLVLIEKYLKLYILDLLNNFTFEYSKYLNKPPGAYKIVCGSTPGAYSRGVFQLKNDSIYSAEIKKRTAITQQWSKPSRNQTRRRSTATN